MLVVCDMPPHEWVSTEDGAKEVLQHCMQQPLVAFDTETDTLNYMEAKALLFSIGTRTRRVAFPGKLLPIFEPLFYREQPLTAHNAKYDAHVVENTIGVRIKAPLYDTLMMARMENTERSSYDLKFLAGDGLFSPYNSKHIKYDKIFGSGVKGTTKAIERFGLQEVANYASKDSYAALIINLELQERLKNVVARDGKSMLELYNETQLPFTKVLYECERNGIHIDKEHLIEKGKIAEKKIEELAEEFVFRARTPINLNSPKQLVHFFHDVLNKPIVKYTKGGKTGVRNPSVDVTVLKKWASEGDAFARLILEYRAHSKVYSTYIKSILEKLDAESRIHTNLIQSGTSTGRLASKDPNLQNIPRIGDDGDIYRIREAFQAPKGKVLIGADYDQLEMRIMAELAGEPKMIEMINKGWDVHSANASLVFGVDYEDIVKAKKAADEAERTGAQLNPRNTTLLGYRQQVKKVGFGINYGAGPYRISQELGISKEEAKLLIDKYFEPYQNVKLFIKEAHEYIRENGEMFTISGRKRHLSGVFSSEFSKVSAAEREGLNLAVQGSAADIVNEAMILCYKSKKLRELDCNILMQVHDELIFEVPEESAEEAKPIVGELMQQPFSEEFNVKITATPKIGKKWTDVH